MGLDLGWHKVFAFSLACWSLLSSNGTKPPSWKWFYYYYDPKIKKQFHFLFAPIKWLNDYISLTNIPLSAVST